MSVSNPSPLHSPAFAIRSERQVLAAIRFCGHEQGEHTRILDASLSDFARLTGLTRDEVRGALERLQQQQILRLLTPRTRGERGPENRKKSRWLLEDAH